MIINEIRSIEFDRNKNKIFGIKSAILWGREKGTNSFFPLLYITKPKSLSQENYDLIIERLEINIRLNP